MTSSTGTRAMAEYEKLLPRGGEVCVECDDSKQLVCPACKPKEQCQFFFPTSCSECARAYCAPADPAPSNGSSSNDSKPSAGAIAGGVVGGVAAIAIITYLVWRFCIKTRRQQQPAEKVPSEEEPEQSVDAEKAFAQRRDQRSSTHTAHSIASTVLTRASNIIQIAYIPGVTNRATPTSPTVLVPPVPPIPIAISQANSPANTEDQHFFVPGDLRDSTYSGLSANTDRTSYATRTSYAPRSSVASTVYGKNAVIVAAQQTGMRAKPEMVSVKTLNPKSSGVSAPPVPAVDYEKYNNLRPPSPAGSTFSVGSTFLNNASAHTAQPARAQMIRVGTATATGNSNLSPSKSNATSLRVPGEASSPLREATPADEPTVVETVHEVSPTLSQGPFSDPPDAQRNQSSVSLSAVIEEATQRASQRHSNVPSSSKSRERSPFGDENATQD